MIFEVLLPIPVNDKTFYYKGSSNRKLKVGELIEVNFRKKKTNWNDIESPFFIKILKTTS